MGGAVAVVVGGKGGGGLAEPAACEPVTCLRQPAASRGLLPLLPLLPLFGLLRPCTTRGPSLVAWPIVAWTLVAGPRCFVAARPVVGTTPMGALVGGTPLW